MFVLLIAGAELMAGASISLWLLALVFLASRILHGVGMAFTRNSPKLRHYGMVLTLLSFLGAIIFNIVAVAVSA